MVDAHTKKTLQSIPLLQTRASPRDKDLWIQRLKEEYQALIKVKYFHFVKFNYFKFFSLYSMFKIIKHQIQIGLDWRVIKKALGGLENAGTFIIC